MATNEELIIAALRESIAKMVPDYEMQIAHLRVQITRLTEERDAKAQAVQDYTDSLTKSDNSQD